MRQPELLLLDEPLANLDVLAQQVILEDLKSICNSQTKPIALILSSQQLYEVEKVSDKVIFLKNGKYEEPNEKETKQNELIVEIESQHSREEFQKALADFELKKLIFNGGVYLCYFEASTQFSKVLEALGKSNLEITYIRNISQSTRRFFVS